MRHRPLFLIAFVVLGGVCSLALADDLQDLKNPDINVRLEAFHDLIDGVKPASLAVEPLRSALVGLLDTEVKSFNAQTATSDDLALGDYFSDVITVVVRLHDPRSISSLVSVLDTGNMVIDSVVSFGPGAVDAVISHANDSENEERGVVMITLTRMIGPTNPNRITDSKNVQAIRQTLIQGESDADSFVAAFAETGVATLVSPSGIPGDVNGDGKVDCTDVALVKASFGKRSTDSGFDLQADVNGDGVINVKDLAFVSQQLPPGTKCQ